MENCYSVIKVRCCPVRNFSAIVSNGYALLRAFVWEGVGIRTPASLSITESVDKGERKVKSTLKFDSPFDFRKIPGTSVIRKNFCYEVTCADGTQFLLGTHSKPWPLTTVKRDRGSVTGNQMYQFQVTLEDNKVLPIIKN